MTTAAASAASSRAVHETGPSTGTVSRLDRRAVQAHGVGARVVRRHEEQLVGALEGARERARIRVVPAADGDPSHGEPLGLGHVADGHGDLVGGKPFEEVVDGRPVECAGGTGDNDHEKALRRRDPAAVIDGITAVISSIHDRRGGSSGRSIEHRRRGVTSAA
jgi:hypothetical protein